MERCYLVHVNLGGKPSRHRITEAATRIKELISKLSPDHQLAYTSGDGTTFGFFIKSSLHSWQVAHRINSPGSDDPNIRSPIIPSPLLHDDSMLVLEVGQDSSGVGKTRVAAWLRFHRPSPNQEAKPETVHGEAKAQSQLASQLAAIKGKLGKRPR